MKEVKYKGRYITTEAKLVCDDQLAVFSVSPNDDPARCGWSFGEGEIDDLIDGLRAAELIPREPAPEEEEEDNRDYADLVSVLGVVGRHNLIEYVDRKILAGKRHAEEVAALRKERDSASAFADRQTDKLIVVRREAAALKRVLKRLVDQIEATSPVDDHGHKITMNVAFLEAKKIV